MNFFTREMQYRGTVHEGISGPQIRIFHKFRCAKRRSDGRSVVEDEDTVCRVTVRILESHGYRVLQARQGEEGLRTADNHNGSIHLILSDIVMPLLGGLEMMEFLRKSRPEAKLLFMSGFTEGRSIEWLHDDVGVPLVVKPFTRRILIGKVREVLDGCSLGNT